MQELRVHHLPREIAPEALAGSTVVVIDLLRATSTICQALAAGATEVVPFLEVDEAVAAAASDRANIVLGGERHGKRIDGFDLGNSPSEYTSKAVGGRRVFITTTNGTRALYHARMAARVLVGSYLNLSALTASLKSEPQVDVLCAGTDGDVTSEDIMAAGALVNQLRELSKSRGQLNDNARSAANYWGKVRNIAELTSRNISDVLQTMLRESAGGRNLIEIGHDHDLVDCARIDALDIVPELDIPAWRITVC